MKLYPIIGEWKRNVNNNSFHWEGKWKNWTNTYLTEINSKIISLFDYVFYFNPDFYQCFLTQVESETESLPTVQLSQLPFHGYYRVNNKIKDITTNKTLSPGTLVVSYGRAEGEPDNRNALNRNKESNYTIQPFGWASYYIMQFDNHQMNFIYESKAEEAYGLKYTFVFDTYSKRYFIRQKAIEDGLKDTALGHTSISFLAHEDITNKNKWYIVNQNQNGPISSIWTNITTNPLMHEFYFIHIPPEDLIEENNSAEQDKKLQNLYNYEEIIFDHTWETSSKVADTNIAVYTINRKDSSHWPNLDFLWLEAW